MLAASVLVGVGGIALWELIEGASAQGSQQAISLLETSTGQSSGQTTAQSVPAGYVFVTGLAALNGKTSVYFNHPAGGLSILLSLNGQWKAFDATCTHAPCTVNYGGSRINCPCHGGEFDPTNGAVISGPPPSRLTEYGVFIQGENLYVSGGAVN